MPALSRHAWIRIVALAAVAAIVAVLTIRPIVLGLVASRIRAVAASRECTARWSALELTWGGRIALRDLCFLNGNSDSTVYAREARLAIAPASLITGHPRPSLVEVQDLRVWLRPRTAPDPDTLAPEPAPERAAKVDRSHKIVNAATAAVNLLLVPAHRLPRVTLRDAAIVPASSEESIIKRIELSRLDVLPGASRTTLVATGAVTQDERVPFDVAIDYARDGRLAGRSTFLLPTGAGRETLALAIDGVVLQDRHQGVVRLEDSTRVTLGRLPIRVSGSLARTGPHLALSLAADQVTAAQAHAALPPVMLGPLRDVSVRGSFDYRLDFDLDLARPEAVEFQTAVVRHGLTLDPSRTALNLAGLDQPFTATIHLPHDRRVPRELSGANPHFRPLASLDSTLAHAVITNEDGGFFHHRGFNPEAVRNSIAENIRAGAYRRGAGTITMQLVRNLWLGHERTLSRKMQEVVLAWMLENLTSISKQRLLEIYLNIIEWGPSVFGADEACTYYFGHDAGRVTVAEALFLATVVPAPTKWRYRFDSNGELRPFERAQMHFIGRAMIAKGWLTPEALPPADSLHVMLGGAAHDVVFPPAVLPAVPPADTTTTPAGQHS